MLFALNESNTECLLTTLSESIDLNILNNEYVRVSVFNINQTVKDITLTEGADLYHPPYWEYAGLCDPTSKLPRILTPPHFHRNSHVHIFACLQICMHVLLFYIL